MQSSAAISRMIPKRAPPPGAAACPARLRCLVRRRRPRRRDARIRRSPRPAVPPVARHDQRPGAVGVEPRLVGRLSGAAVLSPRRSVPGRAARLAHAGRAVAGERLPGGPLACLPPARCDDLSGGRPAHGAQLARAAVRFRGPDAVGRCGQRGRGRRARGHDRRAPGVGAVAGIARGPLAVDRSRRLIATNGTVRHRADRAASPRTAPGRLRPGRARRVLAGAAPAPEPRGAERACRRRGPHRVLDAASACAPRRDWRSASWRGHCRSHCSPLPSPA
jgi:hypothetical protein